LSCALFEPAFSRSQFSSIIACTRNFPLAIDCVGSEMELESNEAVEPHCFGVLEGDTVEAGVSNRRHAAREGGVVTALGANTHVHDSLLAWRMTESRARRGLTARSRTLKVVLPPTGPYV
jgi:hypothetical protein